VDSPVSAGQKFLQMPRKKLEVVGTYRLTEDAKADLIRIYQRGLLEFGEAQADDYYNAFFDRFEFLAEQPFSYPAVDGIRNRQQSCIVVLCGANIGNGRRFSLLKSTA
jgi:plasmid stabilization system protein ParE